MLGSYFPRIHTVTGTLPASEVSGQVLPQEFLRADTRWGIGVPSDPHRWLDEERYVIAELNQLGKQHGLGLVVEQSCLGMGRDADGLARIAAACHVPVVAATGFAAEPFSGELIRGQGVDALTTDLLHEIGAGLDGTGVRPGLIIAATWGDVPTPAEERAVVAAARAALRTGLPLAADGLHLLDLLLSHGVPAHRLSVRTAEVPAQRKVAESGAYVQVREAEHVLALLEAGHADRILLSSGVCRQGQLAAYGGPGYGRVFTEVLPALRHAGIAEAILQGITHDNPIRWLSR